MVLEIDLRKTHFGPIRKGVIFFLSHFPKKNSFSNNLLQIIAPISKNFFFFIVWSNWLNSIFLDIVFYQKNIVYIFYYKKKFKMQFPKRLNWANWAN